MKKHQYYFSKENAAKHLKRLKSRYPSKSWKVVPGTYNGFDVLWIVSK